MGKGADANGKRCAKEFRIAVVTLVAERGYSASDVAKGT